MPTAARSTPFEGQCASLVISRLASMHSLLLQHAATVGGAGENTCSDAVTDSQGFIVRL
jgi:hypothetical protein